MHFFLQQLFFCDWDRGVSGTILKNGKHVVKNDFAMKIESLVEAGTFTGYYANVKREHDKKVE